MTIRALVIREIRYRSVSFLLAVTAVLAAAGCLAATFTLLRGHDLRSRQIINAKIAQVENEVRRRQADADRQAGELNEAFRKIMLEFGYNLIILPARQKLLDYQLQGAASEYMDEEKVRILSESRIMTVRHLLPVLQQRQILIFGDKRQEIFLIGTRGEVPSSLQTLQKPLLSSVPPGEAIVGHDIHSELGVDVGDKIGLIDREFRVARIYPHRGTSDDSSVWIDLAQAQQLLGQPGKINAILALSCICTGAELGEISRQIERILPGTQVRVMTSDAVIRYESRARTAAQAEAMVREARERGSADIEREAVAQSKLRGEIEAFAAWVVPMILIVCAAWTGLLALGNVRERRGEIGILRTLGLRSRQIFTVFLARAMLVGALGAFLGYAIGFLVALMWKGPLSPGELFDPLLLAGVLLLGPILSALAAWIPAMIAAGQDPAVILQEA